MRAQVTALVAAGWLWGQVLAQGQTVVLQQGVTPSKDYAGCRTATLWPKGPATRPTGAEQVLCLRGESNRLLLKFEIPADLKGKSLARARLWLFLPKAQKMFRYCEIPCHGMLAAWEASANWTDAGTGQAWQRPGGDFDNATDYHNGRPPGACDSRELYAPNHGNWYNLMSDLTVGVPQGGMWIAFNVTPLAEKWLTDPAGNCGVMLAPIRDEDDRFPNQWEIDIPSEKSGDAGVRPKLELELAPVKEPVQAGMTPSLTKVNPWSTRYEYRGDYRRQYDLYLAGNEWEGFQVVVHPWLKDLSGVKFTWDDLVDAKTGRRLPKGQVVWHCQDVLKMVSSWLVRDMYFGGKCYWVPDPLVPGDLSPDSWRTVRRQQATPFWFTVHAPAGTTSGDYATTITLSAEGIEPVQMKLTVHVWDYEIPPKWNFAVVGGFGFDGVRQFYGDQYKPEMMDAWYDFLMDHRLVPTEQYSSILSPRMKLDHCLQRGVNVVYVSGNLKTTSDLNALKRAYEQVKAAGCIDYAVIYVEDEGQMHAMRRQLAGYVRQAAPEAMMMVGGAYPHAEVLGHVDVWDPEIDVWPGKKLSVSQARQVVQECQGRGERFFWYVAAGPTAPHPNVQLEYPLVGARVFLWMSWKYRVTGLEYYCYNLWGYNTKGAKRWPEAPWDARAFVSRNSAYNCDGMLFYPGPKGTPCSSLRLENIRDGVEDWESLHLLRDYADALRNRAGAKPSAQAADLLRRADAMLDVPDEVVTSVSQWSQDGDLLLKTRKALGDLIVAVKAVVPQAEYEKVRDARLSDQLARQRKMLRQRVQEAATRAATQTAPAR